MASYRSEDHARLLGRGVNSPRPSVAFTRLSRDLQHLSPGAERQRLGDVLLVDGPSASEIGDRPRDPPDPVEPATAEPSRAYVVLEQSGRATRDRRD